tara:strand:- start:512 stop:958 length:447 start_codon:yes stop_codon:yes gene_type:complete
MNDQLTDCKRCKGNACYEQNISKDLQTWLCMGCGFTTSTVMSKGGQAHNNLLETSPELYKDLLFEDDVNRIWAPSTITLPNKGMVFLDGSNLEQWKWASVKSIGITDDDRKTKKFPTDQTHKMDMKNIKHYDQKDFMTALENIGFYKG